MCNQINVRPDATTKSWLVRQAQAANLPVATYAKNLLQEAAAELQCLLKLKKLSHVIVLGIILCFRRTTFLRIGRSY